MQSAWMRDVIGYPGNGQWAVGKEQRATSNEQRGGGGQGPCQYTEYTFKQREENPYTEVVNDKENITPCLMNEEEEEY